ncbi:type I glyceraldehyde-3-phosphate dehydrogenase [Saccharomonospora azurea]|uniref:Glyceraldehyde-3-phosphate dehydrogenase/erythrose-4-phosphate dehydrogenase n=1 Tax=Saccharomonospora azurea NA-128 TaxID=882081 RepID=H8GEC4_9PSEU|nr:glyceraldehyde 3-phosphate dehydrogenase NAD-binding domain-containing protein [Saccharomonospora azurea]EHK80249.1 glyceraldehyde-3-phosphate dehydrogenase/erythrose-4-phosphate dehydrogenase [Saccharomonospora azurea SZMC 14600]EHY87919.1 glyceraldehyde-3-phosphate dehydrogenase/erythrose-4-phosphate dehydrogenase [Saccharomonospora azurea NA-128]
MTLVLGVNGFGRVGRALVRCVLARSDGAEPVEVVAVNDPADRETLAYLLEYDSTYGRLDQPVHVRGHTLCVGPHRIALTQGERPGDVDWRRSGVDVVVETTAPAPARRDAAAHLDAGAGKVIVAGYHPDADATIAVGINDDDYDPRHHHVVSAASGAAHCVAPMLRVLHRAFGVRHGILTTIHSYTNDQSLLDRPHRDRRRSRSAAVNIVPTTTGAPRSLSALLPELAGATEAVSVRVPVEDGSLADLTVVVGSPVTTGQVNRAFADASSGRLRSHLRYTETPLVSRDVVGSAESCVFDAGLTTTCAGLVKVFGWYDNEWGYAHRLLELAELLNPGGS